MTEYIDTSMIIFYVFLIFQYLSLWKSVFSRN